MDATRDPGAAFEQSEDVTAPTRPIGLWMVLVGGACLVASQGARYGWTDSSTILIAAVVVVWAAFLVARRLRQRVVCAPDGLHMRGVGREHVVGWDDLWSVRVATRHAGLAPGTEVTTADGPLIVQRGGALFDDLQRQADSIERWRSHFAVRPASARTEFDDGITCDLEGLHVRMLWHRRTFPWPDIAGVSVAEQNHQGFGEMRGREYPRTGVAVVKTRDGRRHHLRLLAKPFDEALRDANRVREALATYGPDRGVVAPSEHASPPDHGSSRHPHPPGRSAA